MTIVDVIVSIEHRPSPKKLWRSVGYPSASDPVIKNSNPGTLRENTTAQGCGENRPEWMHTNLRRAASIRLLTMPAKV